MEQQVTDLIAEFSLERDIVKRAGILKQLQKVFNVPLIRIAERTGMKPSYISHIMRINRLSPLIIDGYYSGSISGSHLFMIARVKDPERAAEVYEKVLTGSLSVGATENLIREVLHGISDKGEHIDKKIVEKFSQDLRAIGFEAKVIQTRARAKVILETKGNLEETTKRLKELMNGQDHEEAPENEVLQVADL